MGTLANSEDPENCCSFSSGSTLLAMTKSILRVRNIILLRNYNPSIYAMDHLKSVV